MLIHPGVSSAPGPWKRAAEVGFPTHGLCLVGLVEARVGYRCSLPAADHVHEL
jgi:hypothetical protein